MNSQRDGGAEASMGDASRRENAGEIEEPPLKKQRKAQSVPVDPKKYFEISGEDPKEKNKLRTKYGCSICGKEYSWKKSLNKHWKDKHKSDSGNTEDIPLGMQLVLDKGDHVHIRHRHCMENLFLDLIKIKKEDGDSTHNTSQTACIPHQDQAMISYCSAFIQTVENQGDEMDSENNNNSISSTQPGKFRTYSSSRSGTGSATYVIVMRKKNPQIMAQIDTTSQAQKKEEMDPGSSEEIEEGGKDADSYLDENQIHSIEDNHERPPVPNFTDPKDQIRWKVMKEVEICLNVLNQLEMKQQDTYRGALQCPICDQEEETQMKYSAHIGKHLTFSYKEISKCAACRLHLRDKEELNRHFLDNHPVYAGIFQDTVSNQSFIQQLKSSSSTPSSSAMSGAKSDKCPLCPFVGKYPAELAKHSVSHSTDRPFHCRVCGSTYKWQWDLSKHFNNAHRNLPNLYKGASIESLAHSLSLLNSDETDSVSPSQNVNSSTPEYYLPPSQELPTSCVNCPDYVNVNVHCYLAHGKEQLNIEPSEEQWRSLSPPVLSSGTMSDDRLKHARRVIKQYPCALHQNGKSEYFEMGWDTMHGGAVKRKMSAMLGNREGELLDCARSLKTEADTSNSFQQGPLMPKAKKVNRQDDEVILAAETNMILMEEAGIHSAMLGNREGELPHSTRSLKTDAGIGTSNSSRQGPLMPKPKKLIRQEDEVILAAEKDAILMEEAGMDSALLRKREGELPHSTRSLKTEAVTRNSSQQGPLMRKPKKLNRQDYEIILAAEKDAILMEENGMDTTEMSESAGQGDAKPMDYFGEKGAKVFQCGHCSFTCNRNYELRFHWRRHAKNKNITTS